MKRLLTGIFLSGCLTVFFQATDLMAQTQSSDQRIVQLDSIASALFIDEKYADALDKLLLETKLLEPTPADPRYIQALLKMGLCYEQLNIPFKAIEVNKRALTLHRSDHQEDLFTANRCNNIASLYLTMDDKELARQWSDDAMHISNQIKPEYADRLNHLSVAARIAFARNDYQHAIQHQQERLDIAAKYIDKHHDDYLDLLATLRSYYSGAGDQTNHEAVSEQIKQLKKEIEEGIIPSPTDLSTPALCRRHNLEALLCSRWILGNYLSTTGMKQAADYIIQFRKRTPDVAVYIGPAEQAWVKKNAGFYVAYIAASVEYALQHADEPRFSVEQYKAVMYRVLDYYKENKDFAGEIKRFDSYLDLREKHPEELEKRFEKNFADFTDSMNSKKKHRIIVDDPVMMNFTY